MKTLRKLWRGIPRKARIAIHICVIFLSLIALYTFFGAPTLSAAQAFRRYEKANMVGPAQILGTVKLEEGYGSYRQMLIADDGDAISLFFYDHAAHEDPKLIYREKTGDLTVLGAPYPTDARTRKTNCFYPIFLFDEYPEAVRAELELTLSAEYFGEGFEKTYSLTAQRSNPGYFKFLLRTYNRSGLGVEGYAIQVMALISGYEGKSFRDWSVPVTVKLYNEADELICERSLEITSVMTQAHATATQ